MIVAYEDALHVTPLHHGGEEAAVEGSRRHILVLLPHHPVNLGVPPHEVELREGDVEEHEGRHRTSVPGLHLLGGPDVPGHLAVPDPVVGPQSRRPHGLAGDGVRRVPPRVQSPDVQSGPVVVRTEHQSVHVPGPVDPGGPRLIHIEGEGHVVLQHCFFVHTRHGRVVLVVVSEGDEPGDAPGVHGPGEVVDGSPHVLRGLGTRPDVVPGEDHQVRADVLQHSFNQPDGAGIHVLVVLGVGELDDGEGPVRPEPEDRGIPGGRQACFRHRPLVHPRAPRSQEHEDCGQEGLVSAIGMHVVFSGPVRSLHG